MYEFGASTARAGITLFLVRRDRSNRRFLRRALDVAEPVDWGLALADATGVKSAEVGTVVVVGATVVTRVTWCVTVVLAWTVTRASVVDGP